MVKVDLAMLDKQQVRDRIDALGKEIHRGWVLYGHYMDTQSQDCDEAREVHKVIRALEREKAELQAMIREDSPKAFLGDNSTYLDSAVESR